MNKTAFVISIVLTTFVLMAFGGIVYALRTPDVAAATDAVQEEASPEAAATTDPSLEQTLLEREAVYQQRLAEANARLEQVQQQLLVQATQASPQASAPAAPTQITPEQAMQVAADFLGQNSIYWVEIVTVKGEEMYMVTFTSGEAVYVNMAGQVVGSAPSQFSGGSGGGGGLKMGSSSGNGGGGDSGGGEHSEHEDGHEGGDD